jgi:hypothetical protein
MPVRYGSPTMRSPYYAERRQIRIRLTHPVLLAVPSIRKDLDTVL